MQKEKTFGEIKHKDFAQLRHYKLTSYFKYQRQICPEFKSFFLIYID